MIFDEHKPIYLQIADDICAKILNEAYAEEERIPSIREMAATIGVNPNTVARSFDYLKSIEVIYDKRGLGYFITPNAKRAVKRMHKTDFMQNELPAIAKKMALLDITPHELMEKIQHLLADSHD